MTTAGENGLWMLIHSANLENPASSQIISCSCIFPCAKKDHRYVLSFEGGFQDAADFVAVHLRHLDVQQDQVRLTGMAFAGSKPLRLLVATLGS